MVAHAQGLPINFQRYDVLRRPNGDYYTRTRLCALAGFRGHAAPMAYRSVLVDRLFVVRWIGTPTTDDLASQLREVRAASQAAGHMVVYVAVVPRDMPPLTGPVRTELMRLAPELLKYCHAVYNVIEGTGFAATLLRSMVAGMVFASNVRGKAHVHATVDSVLAHLCPVLGMDREAVTAQLRAAQII